MTAPVCPTCGSAHGSDEQRSSDDVLRAVANEYSVRVGDIVGTDRSRTIALARHVSALLLRFVCRQSYPEIGRTLGNRDHSTAMHGVSKIAAAMLVGDRVCSHVATICTALAHPAPQRAWLQQFVLARAVERTEREPEQLELAIKGSEVA